MEYNKGYRFIGADYKKLYTFNFGGIKDINANRRE